MRLETAEKLKPEMEKYFCEKFKISPEQIFRTKMPMKLSYVFSISGDLPDSMKRSLIYPPFVPQASAHVQEKQYDEARSGRRIFCCSIRMRA